MNLHAFILAGGSGERLWPLSTKACPKQFLTLLGGKSLLAQACERLEGLIPAEHCHVITAESLLDATRRALPTLPRENIHGEPMRRNTAAAIAWACGLIHQSDPTATLAFLASDHLITAPDAFRNELADAAELAHRKPLIVTLGITPTCPTSRYGYIECGDPVPEALPHGTRFASVRRFIEKPAPENARAYLETGAFLWNAGLFISRADTLAEAFRQHAPAWLPLIEAPTAAHALYPTLPTLSIDYALIEHCPNLAVGQGDFGWDDVGTYEALAAHLPHDAQGNTLLAPTVTLDTSGTLVLAHNAPRTTALLGIHDLLVIHTPKATLLCPRAEAHRLPELLKKLPPDLQ